MNTRKSCLVTGCSAGGVGASLAEAFKDKGYHVYATARSPSKVPRSLHEASNATVLALDVTSSESIAAVAETVKRETGGRLAVLINNAGLGLELPALDTPIAEARRVFDSNFFAILEMIQVFSPMLIAAGGCIVNNSSVGGRIPIPFCSIYNGTKAALIQAGEGWRLELAPLGVRVLTLITGGIETNFLKNLPGVNLPPDSYYLGIADIIRRQPEKVPMGISPEAFSVDVVHQVERGTTGKYWIGGGSTLARLSLWLLPQWAIDRISYGQKPFADELAAANRKTS
ncbi:hypothetical protein N7494_008530 [Penicillium frequentans]|uniref:NADPH-dependent 1-acyldihydroxyacetone phosphate reductase n=1 Tax=Penicillium frequentans TaxID=3151616 RepID=A0AAD6GCJ4_9EURO|nr:hypothetical protein N7494_008530 [Penicillium glabrum]